ncbi:hypothetical protein SGQ44_06255 [Flavobacterium sp. Fl-77]|uniref:Quinol oxidase subunit 4 n=1 Tax=Flavobacterium flavipigmentatum TaxID=2893884 RepID=A0AAJ2SBJ4_9FLAO|nr:MULTISPECIES: hypothetical protein [unclassified Flavobacterium]MDX6181615.1 hypothetical protein [Flavobacterium sp. Fl-33]MDX6185351.1 hypothetical protein [Flavobacterium sp. Fl-77]UFH40591.1 hypothetical protein LNP22_11985 [Flavobacterium sp. F-70]
MKTSKYTKVAVIVMVILFVVISVISCTAHVHNGSNKVPPGQAKKMSGSKSAKAYAPGQQKKH